MSGAGNMQSMNTIIRNNRNLLRKISVFKKDSSFMSARKAYLKAFQGEVDIRKLSKQELRKIREKVIKEREKESLRLWIISFLITISILFLSYNLYNSFIEYQNKKLNENFVSDKGLEKILIERENQKKIKKYEFYINNGDNWIEKQNWKNAIFQYKNAVKEFPEKYEANYRLALGYSYNCKFLNKDCDKGLKLVERLLKVNPNDSDLLILKEIMNK
jgi:tetratricopeptide (TPR) repeat protein